MNKNLKMLVFGAIIWAVPWVLSIALSSLMKTDEIFYKSIIIVVAAFVWFLFAYIYFKSVDKNFIVEGITIGLLWFAISIVLDLILTVPFIDGGVAVFFKEIGLRYLTMPIMGLFIGMILADKTKSLSNKNHDQEKS